MVSKSCEGMFDDVIDQIVPDDSELRKERSIAESIIESIRKAVPHGCEVVLVGSVAKGTFLKGSNDLDIFILFDRKIGKDCLKSSIIRIMEKAFPGKGYQLNYAEHPYLRFHCLGRKVDLVPAYRIANAEYIASSVDRSVLHTGYVLENLSEEQRVDVILLKSLLKAYSLYGAEIKIQGFSGYLCELLIISCRTFQGLMHRASIWKEPVFFDPADHYKDENQPLDRFKGPLIIIDPTDRKRNVAAALSRENFKKFVRISRFILKNKDSRTFLRKPKTFRQKVSSAKRRNIIYLITMPRPDVVDDVLWGQIHKLMSQLRSELSDFQPGKLFADDLQGIRIAVPLKKDILQDTEEIEGPPLYMTEHVSKFRDAHRSAGLFERDGRLIALRKRKNKTAHSAIELFFSRYSEKDSHLSYPIERIDIRCLDDPSVL